MSDIFDIIPKHTSSPTNNHSQHQRSHANYIQLQANFLANNYGLYTIRFIEMLAQDAAFKCPQLQVIGIHKILREVVKKFMLSDLELVYVGHICNLLEWNIRDAFIRRSREGMRYEWECVDQGMYLLIVLSAYFVKKYVGDAQQCRGIASVMRQECSDSWQGLYQQWLSTCPTHIFKLSPRAINELYTRYTRNCQKTFQPKNYNKMVDQIMQLSTSYSMIPGNQTKQTKKKSNLPPSPFQDNNHEQLHSFGRKIIKVNQLFQGSSKYLQPKNQSLFESSLDANAQSGRQKEKKYKLGLKKNKETRINNNVTEFFKDKSSISMTKRFTPHSMIGMGDPSAGVNFFDSKLFSSGEDIIPYTLRSNSNIFKSKWLQ